MRRENPDYPSLRGSIYRATSMDSYEDRVRAWIGVWLPVIAEEEEASYNKDTNAAYEAIQAIEYIRTHIQDDELLMRLLDMDMNRESRLYGNVASHVLRLFDPGDVFVMLQQEYDDQFNDRDTEDEFAVYREGEEPFEIEWEDVNYRFLKALVDFERDLEKAVEELADECLMERIDSYFWSTLARLSAYHVMGHGISPIDGDLDGYFEECPYMDPRDFFLSMFERIGNYRFEGENPFWEQASDILYSHIYITSYTYDEDYPEEEPNQEEHVFKSTEEAIHFLENYSLEASSSHFYPGGWYYSTEGIAFYDEYDGDELIEVLRDSVHPHGPEESLRAIWEWVTGR